MTFWRVLFALVQGPLQARLATHTVNLAGRLPSSGMHGLVSTQLTYVSCSLMQNTEHVLI